MAVRPYWSGQLKISLASFGIQLFPAINPASEISFHQIDRATGERIRHLNVTDGNRPVNNSDIIKGFEYSKGKYIAIEPEDVKRLRLKTKSSIEIAQFVDADELPPYLFEKPYFVVPDPKGSVDAFAVIQTAIAQAGKVAIGEVAVGGREHLIAIAPPPDRSFRGLMAYTLRYAEELRDAKGYFSKIEERAIDKKELALAQELIRTHSSPFNLKSYRDDYEAALRVLIEAKRTHTPLPAGEEKLKPPKVVSLMDALRRSVNETKHPNAHRRASVQQPRGKGPVLVKPGRRSRKAA